MLVYVSRVSVIVECPRFSWTTFAGQVRPQWCSPGSDPNLGGSEPCGVGRSVVELGLRVALGGDPAPVVLDLPLDPRGVPAQDRSKRPCETLAAERENQRADTLEKSQRLLVVVHQQILCLLVVGQHHLVILAPDTRLFVSAKRGMRWIQMVTVRPDPARFNPTSYTVGAVYVPRPHSGP